MSADKPYRVRWILVPHDKQRTGLYGTTTHVGTTPALAAIASAETIFGNLPDARYPCDLQVVAVFSDERSENLLDSQALRTALRHHYRALPCNVDYRPLC